MKVLQCQYAPVSQSKRSECLYVCPEQASNQLTEFSPLIIRSCEQSYL